MTKTVCQPELVAFCGLYCGACSSFQSKTCPGCAGNEKATWCKIRRCCLDHGRRTCADCLEHPDPKTCSLYHNLFSRLIGWWLGSDRSACIAQIRALGVEGHAGKMAQSGQRTLPARPPA